MRAQGYHVVFLDEICTTKTTLPKREWAARGENLNVDYHQFSKGCISTIGAISAERGVEMVMNFDKSVDQHKFVQFIKKVRQGDQWSRVAFFMDQLRVHTCRTVTKYLALKKIVPILNAAYSPDFNPIESAFSVVKREIKKARIQGLVRGEEEDLDAIIKAAFKKVNK